MRVDQFVLDATKCSGHLQRILKDDETDVSSIMENLAHFEVIAVQPARLGDHIFDVVRLGVKGDAVLRVEIRQHWNRDRILLVGAKVLSVAILVGIALAIGHLL